MSFAASHTAASWPIIVFIPDRDHKNQFGTQTAALISPNSRGPRLSHSRIWDSHSKVRFAPDSPLEGDGFEPSVPRVMGGDLGRQVPALIAVLELAGTAVALQRGTKVVWPHRHPEFP